MEACAKRLGGIIMRRSVIDNGIARPSLLNLTLRPQAAEVVREAAPG